MSKPIARITGYLKYNIMIELCAHNGLEYLDITISSEVENDTSETPVSYSSPTKIIRYDNYQDTLSSLEFFLFRYGLVDPDNLNALKCSDEWLNIENALKKIARGELPEELADERELSDDKQEMEKGSQDDFIRESKFQNNRTPKFNRLKSGDTCPLCEKGEMERIQRMKWMYLLPKSRHYECQECYARFLTLYGWSIRLAG